ncbi:MAG: serine hydrolase domain-containing protein [Pirellulales bacterium]
MRTRCRLNLPVLWMLVALFVAAPSALADEIDDYVEKERQALKIPGIALLVVKDGQTVKAQGYGLANVEHSVPVTAETIFQSGSMGKQFTATGVMMLVEDGRLALDDSVRKVLTDAPESWQPITVRHLLSHTSGLGDYPVSFNLQRDYTEDQLLEAIYKSKLDFAPGDDWRYSNLGYATLGILMHKVAGKPYGEFLAERIFRPLGMTATRIISEADIVPHRAAGYRLVDGELKNQTWVAPTLNTTADGSLYVNLLDMARWNAALDTEQLVKRTTLEQMWTPVPLHNGQPNKGNYGFGWVCEDVAGHRVMQHGGAWQGFVSHIARYPDDRLTVVTLANLSAGSFTRSPGIGRHVAGMYVPALKPSSGEHDE